MRSKVSGVKSSMHVLCDNMADIRTKYAADDNYCYEGEQEPFLSGPPNVTSGSGMTFIDRGNNILGYQHPT